MLSDLRVVNVALDKEACATCGLVRRDFLGSRLFESGYRLYDHATGSPREDARQQAYAAWLSSYVARPPRSILDLGCGNGSLLIALQRWWPSAELRGIDPSPEAVRHARAAGIDANCGSLPALRPEPADLVVSVNVIEHADDPVKFIGAMARLVTESGSLLLICPDGERPWLELLFVDHVWSFSALHLAQLAAAAGLGVAARAAAPSDLGPFLLIQLRPAAAAHSFEWGAEGAERLVRDKHEYLRAWERLDGDLADRAAGAASLACFGIGETAGLLRAYSPGVWSTVCVCVAENPELETFGDLPVIAYTGGLVELPILLGVRPRAQAMIAQRLQEAGCAVIRWDDRIDA